MQEDAGDKSSLERFLTVFHDFDPRLLGVLQGSDADLVTEHGLYERPTDAIPDKVLPPGGMALGEPCLHTTILGSCLDELHD